MNLLAGLTATDDLLKKLNKLLTGVLRGGLAQHLAGLGVERCVERERAVALVFKAMPLSPGRDGPALEWRSFRQRRRWRHGAAGADRER